jgi:hypothetical protein
VRVEKVVALQMLHQISQDIAAISICRAILCAFCDMPGVGRDEFVIVQMYSSVIKYIYVAGASRLPLLAKERKTLATFLKGGQHGLSFSGQSTDLY